MGYDRALASYDGKESRLERISRAEVHRLHGKVLLDLGDIGLDNQDGALWHSEQALKELEELVMQADTDDVEEAVDVCNFDPDDVGRNRSSTKHVLFLKKTYITSNWQAIHGYWRLCQSAELFGSAFPRSCQQRREQTV